MSVENLVDPNVMEHLVEHMWRQSKTPATRATQIVLAAAQRIANEHRNRINVDQFNIELMDAIDPPTPYVAAQAKKRSTQAA